MLVTNTPNLAIFSFQLIHTKPACNGGVCYLGDLPRDRELQSERGSIMRRYSKQHGRPEEDRRKRSDSESDSDSDTECKGYDRVSSMSVLYSFASDFAVRNSKINFTAWYSGRKRYCCRSVWCPDIKNCINPSPSVGVVKGD